MSPVRQHPSSPDFSVGSLLETKSGQRLPPVLLVSGYMAMELMRSLFAEAMYEFSPWIRTPLLPNTHVVFTMELMKLAVAYFAVSRSTKNYSTESLMYFLPPAGLYFINNCLYYSILVTSSTGAMSLLMHLRLPFTAIVHHFLIRHQTSWKAWGSLALVFLGVSIAQLNDNFSLGHPGVIFTAIVICLNSALASVINEKVLKTLDMPFWDQQLRIYALGSAVSFLAVAWTTLAQTAVVSIHLINEASVLAAIGCLVSGSTSGILTGLIIFRLDNIVKVVANSGITILVALSVYGVFGIFPFTTNHFVTGALLLVLGSYLYARATAAPKSMAYAPLDRIPEDSLFGGLNRLSIEMRLLVLGTLAVMGVSISFLSLAKNWSSDLYVAQDSKDVDIRAFKNRPLVVIVYASSVNSGFCRTARSVLANKHTFYATGVGQTAAKEAKPYKYLQVSQKARSMFPDQVLVFMDGYDVLTLQPPEYIVREFKKLGSSIVYSAEKNCWPYVMSTVAKNEMCAKFPPDTVTEKMYAPGQAVRWLNSGIMLCKVKACQKWFEDSIAMKPKYFTTDDQAIAAETCLLHGTECKLDVYSRIAQSMHESVPDLKLIDGQYVNIKTNSTPAFMHFNGNKEPFPVMDLGNRLKLSDMAGRFIHFEDGTKKSFEEVCAGHLPMDP